MFRTLKSEHSTFLAELKARARFTHEGDGAVFDVNEQFPSLEAFVRRCGHFYATADEDERRVMRELIATPEEHLYFIEFAARAATEIRERREPAALDRGLLALAVVGDQIDPRDLGHFLDGLYLSAISARTPDVKEKFETIGMMASHELVNTNIGLTSAAEQMQSYPRIYEMWKERESRFQRE